MNETINENENFWCAAKIIIYFNFFEFYSHHSFDLLTSLRDYYHYRQEKFESNRPNSLRYVRIPPSTPRRSSLCFHRLNSLFSALRCKRWYIGLGSVLGGSSWWHFFQHFFVHKINYFSFEKTRFMWAGIGWSWSDSIFSQWFSRKAIEMMNVIPAELFKIFVPNTQRLPIGMLETYKNLKLFVHNFTVVVIAHMSCQCDAEQS